MEELADYAQVTTIAIILLAAIQAVFILVAIALGVRIYMILKRVNQTSKLSKEFVSDLREQQMKNTSLFKLAMFAFKRAKTLKR